MVYIKKIFKKRNMEFSLKDRVGLEWRFGGCHCLNRRPDSDVGSFPPLRSCWGRPTPPRASESIAAAGLMP